MIVASMGERAYTESTEHGEGIENNQRMFCSVPSPTPVSSVFTRFHPSISARSTDAAGEGALRR